MRSFILAALFIISTNAIASNNSAIELNFNGADGFSTDTYFVPDASMSAESNLFYLSSSGIEGLCYRGNARSVLKKIDQLVATAEPRVKNYSSNISGKTMYINISFVNALNKVQSQALEIQPCNY